jgi:MFS family permease
VVQDKCLNEHSAVIEIKKEKSRVYSIFDGSFWSVMYGFGESFFSAFAVFLKATNLELGFITSFPQMIGSFFQLFSYKLISFFGSRKKVVLIFATLQALMHLLIAIVFFLGEFRLFYLILFICLYWICGMIMGPAWTSWIGDLVDEHKRGSYFGLRSKICGFIAFVAYLFAGFILQRNSATNLTTYYGFLILFIVAFLARLISVIYLSKQYEPKCHFAPEEANGMVNFVKSAWKTNFGIFVIFMCFFNFAVFVSAPFFTAYMLNDLRMSYITFTLVNAIAIISKIFFMPVWGKASDKFGEKKIITASTLMMPLIPLLWMMSTNVWYLLVIQAFSGFVWAGFELATFNYIFSATDPKKRVSYVAYYNVLTGISIFFGALAGSLLVKLNFIFWSQYLFVFFLSFVFRLLTFFIFVPRLKEVREVKSISNKRLIFDVIMATPGTTLRDLFVPLIRSPFVKKTPLKNFLSRHMIVEINDFLDKEYTKSRHMVHDVEIWLMHFHKDDKRHSKDLQSIHRIKRHDFR